MDNPILTTKLNSPSERDHLVPRGALLDRLDEGLSAHCLILISAPAGYGKTTLGVEWFALLVARGVSTAWLSLDEGENNPVIFMRYLVAALRRVYPEVGQELLTLLDLPAFPPIEGLLTGLINELASSHGEMVLVLDDYHTVTSEIVNQAVHYLYSHAPTGLHLVILTRQDPPFALARLRATGQLVEIRQADLRFSSLESEEFLERSMGLALREDQIQRLESRTEGWITGLQIAALSLRGRNTVDEFLETYSGSHHFLFDYLAEEVLRSLSQAVIDFLIQTSILNRLCAPLCDALTGAQDGQVILQHLEQSNLFLDPLDDQRRWYRYHPLFAEFLHKNLDHSRMVTLALKAANWCEANTTLPEAISYAIQSQDTPAIIRLIRLAAPGTLRSGSILTLNDWLDSMPQATLKQNADLLILKGITLMLGNQIEASRYFAALAEQTGGDGLSNQERGLLLGLKAYLAHARYEENEAELLGREAVRLLDDNMPVFKVMVLSMLGQVQRQLGNPSAGEATIREAVRCGEPIGHSLGSVAAGANLIAMLDVLGRRREAETYCAEAVVKLTERGNLNPLSFIICIPWGMIVYQANRLTQARQLLTQGFEDSRRLGFNPIIIGGLPTMALIRSAEGDTPGAIEDARAIFQEATRYQVTWVARMAKVLEVNLALRMDDPGPMEAWLGTAGLDPQHPEPAREEEYTSLARYLVNTGKDEQAVNLVDRLIVSAREQNRNRSLITFGLLLAIARHHLGDRVGSWEVLREAFTLAQPQDYIRLFVDEGQPAFDLLMAYLSQTGPCQPTDPEVETFCQSLIQAFRSTHHQEPMPAVSVKRVQPGAGGLVEPLSPRELEVLSFIAQGLSNPEIARKLYLTTNTLKAHTGSIYGKLDVHSRMAAVVKARELGLIKS